MDNSKLDLLLVDVLVDDYEWDEDRAKAEVVEWRGNGSLNSELDIPVIAEYIWNTSD